MFLPHPCLQAARRSSVFLRAVFVAASLLCLPSVALSSDAAAGVGESVRGVLEPMHQAEIPSQIEAVVIAMPFREGEPFRKNDVLVKLDCGLYKTQLEAATAGEAAARYQFESDREMARLNSIGSLELKLSEVRLRQAESTTALARMQVGRCNIIAPYDGRVVRQLVNLHESVPANAKVLAITSSETPQIRLVVPSRWVTWLTPKSTFSFTLDETGETVTAQIRQVGSLIDPVSQMVPVVADITRHEHPVMPGMSGSATFVRP
jgi:membrane fusion protein (multidrug efflux system)